MSIEAQTIIIIVANIIIGGILLQQIRSQKQIINRYKGLMEATNPDKIITFQKREIEQLTNITSTDIQELKIQIYQLASFTVHCIEQFEKNNKALAYLGKPESFNQVVWINLNMPNCSKVINEIQTIRQQEEVNANQ